MKNIYKLSIILVSLLYLFLRFDQLVSKLDFRLDQAFFLIEARSTVESPKFRLLGPPTSKIFEGRSFFVGSNYYYLLGIIGYLSRWEPLIVTAFFIVLEFVFYLFFIYFLRQKFGNTASLLTFWGIAVSPYLVAHSRFFWNPHMLVPLAIITLVSLERYIDTHKYVYLSIAALAWGLAFSCHYSPIFWLPIFVYYLIKSQRLLKLNSWFVIAVFTVLGDLPFFIFELRHQFYNLRTFFFVYSSSSESAGLTSHYFIFPLLIFVIYFLLKYLRPTFIPLVLLLTIYQFYLYPNYPSFGAVTSWDYPTQQRIADSISNNCPSNFNVAATMQGDTRFYDLRFLLEKNNCYPESVDAYPTSKTLFLVSPYSRLPSDEAVWEVTSLKPFVVTSTTLINDQLNLHRLDRL